MGLFGFKKDENTVKLSDFFSREDLSTIANVLQKNMRGVNYRVVYQQTLAREMVGYASKPDKDLSAKKVKAIIKIAEGIMEFEPSLTPALTEGVKRMRAYEGGQSIEDIIALKEAQEANAGPAKDDLLKAIDQSDLSYEEIMSLINKKDHGK